jgi:hypothetical protein
MNSPDFSTVSPGPVYTPLLGIRCAPLLLMMFTSAFIAVKTVERSEGVTD